MTISLAIVRRRFNPFGGAERFILSATRALAGSGLDITVITEGWEGGEVAGVASRVVSKSGLLRHHRLQHFQRSVAAAIAESAFDLVQSHERIVGADIFRAGDGVHAAWIERLAHERGGIAGRLVGMDPMHRLVIETERRMAADGRTVFVANSALVAREIAERLGVPEHRIRLIENGVARDCFQPADAAARAAARRSLGLPADVPVVALVGSGFERKGAFVLARALALPELAGVHALIAGTDGRLMAFRAELARLDLDRRVQVLGGLYDVRPVLAAADVFVLPSLYDPMPNAALEALASGLPVVTTADTGIAEPLAAAGAGFIVPRQPEAVAAAIAVALRDRDALGAAALALSGRFDLAASTEKWRQLYAEMT